MNELFPTFKNEWLSNRDPIEDQINIGNLGFVRLHRVDGSDAEVCRAARVSYDKNDAGKGPEDDQRLINYMVRNRHSSPMEMISMTFHIKAELFTRSQLVRHRTANWNEQSARYTEMKDEFFIPDNLRNQLGAGQNKQGSSDGKFVSGSSVTEGQLIDIIDLNNKVAFEAYQDLLSNGVAKEQARMVLPQTLYTQWYFRMDGNNLMKMLYLRNDHHAQKEIRDYALAMLFFFRREFPMLYAAWLEYIWQARTFGGAAMELVRELARCYPGNLEGLLGSFKGDELAYLRGALNGESG